MTINLALMLWKRHTIQPGIDFLWILNTPLPTTKPPSDETHYMVSSTYLTLNNFIQKASAESNSQWQLEMKTFQEELLQQSHE
jgi:hypothetical protein